MSEFNKYFDQQAHILIKKANNLTKRDKRQHAYRATILTIYGFQVAIPILLGILIGVLLDKYYPVEHVSWVLNFVLLGAFTGFYNANMWFYRMMELKKKTTIPPHKRKKGGKK